VIATKVGGAGGLGEANINSRLDASLQRLQTDYVDLYYAHRDDPETPLEETLTMFDALVRSGRVRYIAASNYSAARLAAALEISSNAGLARFVALSPHFNLLEREYEGATAELCARAGVACVPYYGLASGFLTGKYRRGTPHDSKRGRLDGSRYLDERGERVLAVMDTLARAHETTPGAVALAWLLAQPTVSSTIASARTAQQLAELLPMAELRLSESELRQLRDAAVTAQP
jgi:aryl-alcohol dehydrogenase-like predicted oxidoreductase